MSKRHATITSIALAALVCSLLAVPAFADSQIRIVRLSQVEGNVQIDRNTGQGYEKAFLNLPITQGSKIRTKAEGRAEIEFEDGSTLRMTPGTIVEFPELSLRDSGAKASTVKLEEGTAYLNFKAAKNDEFTLTFGHEKVALTKPAHLRLEMDDTDATLAVFKGDVQAEGPSGTVSVGSKQTAAFDLADNDQYTLAKNLEPDPYDDWDKQQEQYHQRYSTSNSYSPYGYGVSDLDYYGNFFSVPGYGLMWQPYFASAGWDPFMNGAWYWYPDCGYTWVSAYPWGWMPYRYGSWRFLPGYGWVWQPTGSWAGWNQVPAVVHPPQHFVMPRPPLTPGQVLVVNRGPLPGPVGIGRRLTIRNDSAGLGIARGSIRNLGRVSQQVAQTGSVAQRVHAGPAGSAMAPGSSRGGGVAFHSAGSGMSAPAAHSPSGSHSASASHK